MTGAIGALLHSIEAPKAGGVFHVKQLERHRNYLVGRDADANGAILIRATNPEEIVPVRLAGLEARFSIQCDVAEKGHSPHSEVLTVIICREHDVEVETYFATLAETLIGVLGSAPTTSDVFAAVQKLVDLFQRLRKPPTRPLIGLVGELCVISAANDAVAAVDAWRSDGQDRFDFTLERLRLDAKATAARRRIYSVSFEQANPPTGTFGILASVSIEAAGGGVSIEEFLLTIEGRLGGNHFATLRLREIVAKTLGNTLLAALTWRFDLSLAMSSLAFFDMSEIPAIRPPLPLGVTGVRFMSDLEALPPINLSLLVPRLSAAERALLPA